jgi:hypothetical protein
MAPELEEEVDAAAAVEDDPVLALAVVAPVVVALVVAAVAAALTAETMLDASTWTLLTSPFIEVIKDSALLFACPVAVATTLLKLDKRLAASLVAVNTSPEA